MARFRFDVHVRLDLFWNVGDGLDVFRVSSQLDFVGIRLGKRSANMGKLGHLERIRMDEKNQHRHLEEIYIYINIYIYLHPFLQCTV